MKNIFYYFAIFFLGLLLYSSTVSAAEVVEPELQDEVLDDDSSEIIVDDVVDPEDNDVLLDTFDENQGVQMDITVLSDDISTFNTSVISSMEFSIVCDYVKGVLMNMSNMTDYVFFTEVVDGLRHYYLYYDLDLNENGSIVYKDYPYLDIYNIDGVFYQNSGVAAFTGSPVFAYGSYGNLSALIDKQFHFNELYLILIGVMFMFILFRKRVFS